MEMILAFVGGFTLGVVHAFDADHMAAVTAFAGGRGTVRNAATLGLVWGIGHATTLTLLGLASFLFKFAIPPDIATAAELAVGILLVTVGTVMLGKVLRDRHIHIHRHEHDGIEHVHFHSHRHTGEHRHRHSMFFIGATHGFAGTASILVVIPVAITQSLLTAVGYLVCFGIGTILAMAAFASILGMVAQQIPQQRTLRLMRGAASAACICVGLLWIGGFVWK